QTINGQLSFFLSHRDSFSEMCNTKARALDLLALAKAATLSAGMLIVNYGSFKDGDAQALGNQYLNRRRSGFRRERPEPAARRREADGFPVRDKGLPHFR